MRWISLISDNNGESISIGRITTWILTIILLFFWIGKIIYMWNLDSIDLNQIEIAGKLFEIPDGLVSTWISSLGYNSVKKLNVMRG